MIILIFGDSITWGRGLPTRVGWANLLRNSLEDINPKIHLYDLGIDGNTTQDLLGRIEVEALARKPDVIIWAIGVNDAAYRYSEDKPLVDKSTFNSNLHQLVTFGEKYVSKQLFVGITMGDDTLTQPLPDSTTGKCYKKSRVLDYNDLIRIVCSEANIGFINISDALSDANFYDGLHPNIAGHEIIYQAVLPVINSWIS